MLIESYSRILTAWQLAFPDATAPSFADMRHLDEAVVKRAIETVKANPLTKFYALDRLAYRVLGEMKRKSRKWTKGKIPFFSGRKP